MSISVTDQRVAFGLPFADTVAIQLAARGQVPTPYQMQMFGGGGSIITFPYNAEGFSVSIKPVWADRNLPSQRAPTKDWKRNDAKGVSIRLLLQLDDPADTTKFVEDLEEGAERISAITGEPEIWLFIAGLFQLTGEISSLIIDRVSTDPFGYIELADIQSELAENA